MNRTIAAFAQPRWLTSSLPWQPLLAVAQAVLCPNRWLTLVWALALGLLLVGIFSNAGLPLISGFMLLLSLHLIIPIEINNLSRKKSWLLLPDFKSLVLKLLLLILMLWLVLITVINLMESTPNWLRLPYSALVYSLVMLPTIYVRHLWPLLAEIIMFIAVGSNAGVRSWIDEHGTAPWFTALVITSTIAMWVWMKYHWLNPTQRANSQVTRTSIYALSGLEMPWLLRLTRRTTSLEGTLLLGDGDSKLASLMRALYATWLAPAVYWFMDLIFGGDKKLPTLVLEKPMFVALFILGPLLSLGIMQLKSTQRLARCWLFLGGPRQAMYGFVERKFYQELAAYQVMTVILMFVLIPLPMLLPMLCYGTSATLLLCYLVFALSGRTSWWSIIATIVLLITLLVAMKFLWASPGLIYLTSLALLLPVYSLRRYGKANWLKLDYSQLKPRQLL